MYLLIQVMFNEQTSPCTYRIFLRNCGVEWVSVIYRHRFRHLFPSSILNLQWHCGSSQQSYSWFVLLQSLSAHLICCTFCSETIHHWRWFEKHSCEKGPSYKIWHQIWWWTRTSTTMGTRWQRTCWGYSGKVNNNECQHWVLHMHTLQYFVFVNTVIYSTVQNDHGLIRFFHCGRKTQNIVIMIMFLGACYTCFQILLFFI